MGDPAEIHSHLKELDCHFGMLSKSLLAMESKIDNLVAASSCTHAEAKHRASERCLETIRQFESVIEKARETDTLIRETRKKRKAAN